MQKRYSNYSLQKRLLTITFSVIFLFFIVIIKLFSVQIINGKKLQTRAITQWTRDLTMSGLRGTITDRNGEPLALSYTSYNVYVRANNVLDSEKVATTLCEILGLDYEKTLKKVQNRGVSENLIKTQVPYEQAKQILECGYSGVYLSETSTRYYPYDNLLSNVLGYCTIDNIGQFGLENYYNEFLTGIDGQTYTESTLTGLELSNATTCYTTGIKGCDISLTIELGVQQILQSITQLAQIEQNAKKVQAIVLDATNGEILAMASSPSLNLNDLPRDDINALLENSKNTMICDIYEPGSTFKIFTTAAALEEKVTNLEEKFYDPGYRIVDGQKIKCWKTTGHGSETLVESFANSCNSVFMDLGLRLGTEKLYAYLKKFGIGQKTGIDFDGESSGIMMKQENVKNVDLARISFGQAIAITPIQMLMSVSGILTGSLYKPQLLKSITSQNGIKKEFSGEKVRKTVDKKTSEDILYMMEQVVSKNDGLYSFVPGYRIGGKTGTAQKYENGAIAKGKYISSFVGCYPVDNPKYTMILCVDEPNAGQYYGSLVAAPYAKQIFSGLFEYYGIEPTNLTDDLKKINKTIKMPNLVGLSLTEALGILKSMKLQYELDGENGYVIWQSIAPNEYLFEGAIVLLKL
ncbi:MAG: PASTA domain-containing protein [Clostridia bacterium]|nr:PASTA domain-containing protein [Clostridia bacterium]